MHRKQGLLFKLTFFVLIINIGVAALFGVLKYKQQSLQLKEDLDLILESNAHFFSTSLEIPIYNFDLIAAKKISHAVLQSKAVVSVGIEQVQNVNMNFIKNEYGVIQEVTKILFDPEVKWLKSQITYKGKKLGVAVVGVTRTYLKESLSSTLNFMLVETLVLIFLLVTPLIILLRRQFVIPIQELTKISSKIALGDLNQNVVNYRDDELGELAVAFFSMQDSIRQKIKDLNNEVIERRQAENTVQVLRNYLSNIIDSMPSVLIGVDVEGRINQWNSEAVRLVGVSKNQAVGRMLIDIFPRLSDDIHSVYEVMESRQEKTISNRSCHDGEAVRFEDMMIYPLVANGVTGVVIRLDDITEKSMSEVAFRRAQKMEAVGQLTGGIAHDFNNMLGIVMGNLELLQVQLKGDDKAMSRIERALKGTRRGADLTRKLLQFSRNKEQETRCIDVKEVIGSMDELVAKSLTVSIEIQTHFQDDLWPIEVAPGDFDDAILNLSLNAKDAMPEGGTLIIEASNKVLDEGYVKANPNSKAGDFVLVSVGDNGIGMTDEVRDKVLEPYFTTKGEGKGTGLGLSMVYGFVLRSGGHIKIYSELGKGTTFHIFLPRAKGGRDTDSYTTPSLAQLPTGSETVLIVDDEGGLIDIARKYLSNLGYSVLSATGAKQALVIMAENPNVDLLFSDIIMPGKMDGYQLSEAVHNEYPATKILLTSGFSKNREDFLNSDDMYLLELSKQRLNKPYNQSELAIAVRGALER